MKAVQAIRAVITDTTILERLHKALAMGADKGSICSLDCKPTRHTIKNAALLAADKKKCITLFDIRQVYALEPYLTVYKQFYKV